MRNMIKITIEEVKRLSKEYDLKPCKAMGTDIINIQKHDDRTKRLEEISWDEFERILNKKGLVVYKAENSDFLKIMKKK